MWSGVGILCGAVLMLASVMLPGPAWGLDGYAAVKRALYDQVFADQRETLYCACPFDSARQLDRGACGYLSPSGGERSRRVEVEHVVPASWIGEGRRCWREKICRDRRGRSFKGRKCCLAVDPVFRRAYQDLHNLWPTVGEINEIRRNYRFAEIDGERRTFGRCDFEVDPQTRRAEPKPDIRGDVARIHLYMAETHGVRLDADQHHLFEVWHRSDPPDVGERRRNEIIKKIQGKANPFVDS